MSDAVAHGHVAAHGGAHGHAEHHPALQHQFETMGQQKEAAVLGMWAFLLTEILFFGGLFMAYMLYRTWYHDAFRAASSSITLFWGALNTVVLIGSSLTMALGVRAAQTNKRKATVGWILLTIVLGMSVPRREGDRVRRQVRASPRAGPELRVGRSKATSSRTPRATASRLTSRTSSSTRRSSSASTSR